MFQVQIGSFSKLYLKCSSTVTERRTRPPQLVNPYLKIYSQSLRLPQILSLPLKVHTFDVRRREKSDFELILCSIFVNEIIFPSAPRLNSNETSDFFLLYGSAGAGSEV